MLFTVPSRYWFTIGRLQYLALGRGRPCFPPDVSCPAVLTFSAHPVVHVVAYGALTRSGSPFQYDSANMVKSRRGVSRPLPRSRPTPLKQRRLARSPERFGLFPFRSPLLRESSLFLEVLRCFSSPGAPSAVQSDEPSRSPGCPIRRPLDHRVPAPPQCVSPRGCVLPRLQAPRHPPSAHFCTLVRLPSPCASVPHAGHSSSVVGHQSLVVRRYDAGSFSCALRLVCALPRGWLFFASRLCCCALSRKRTPVLAGIPAIQSGFAPSSPRTSHVSHSGQSQSQWTGCAHGSPGLPMCRAGTRSCRSSVVKVRTLLPSQGCVVSVVVWVSGRIAPFIARWSRGDSNPRPPPCKGGALPTKLRPQSRVTVGSHSHSGLRPLTVFSFWLVSVARSSAPVGRRPHPQFCDCDCLL